MRERLVLPAIKMHPSSLETEKLAIVEMLCIGHHAVSGSWAALVPVGFVLAFAPFSPLPD